MDPITAAIITALAAGAAGGLTETGKTAITDAYQAFKDLLAKKFGARSKVVQAIDHLEVEPASPVRQRILQEEIGAVQAEQDSEVQIAANHLHTLVQPQQAGLGKYTIQNNAPVQGQTIGDHNTVTQHFGELPHT